MHDAQSEPPEGNSANGHAHDHHHDHLHHRHARHEADELTPLLVVSEASPLAPPDEEYETTHRNIKTGSLDHAAEVGEGEQDGDDENGEGDEEDEEDEDKPLPMRQIMLLCYARVVEPVAFFCILPFVNEMIWETGGLDEADVGFYTGLIDALFSLSQMVVMIGWGRAADRFGRKPVLVAALTGVSVGTALFGFSKTIWQMILFRCLAGAFAASVLTIRTMISEHSTKKTQARAFSIFAFGGNIGIFLGPLLGGALAKPADQFPSVFGHVKFFRDYPYAPATVVTGALCFSAAIISLFFIDETLAKEDQSDGPGKKKQQLSTWEILKSPGVAIVLTIYVLNASLGIAYTCVVTVYWFTPPSIGGLGCSPLLISIFIAICGASQSLWLLLAFPPLQRRFGTGGVLRGCSYIYPLFMLLYPVSSILLRAGHKTLFWAFTPPVLVAGSGMAMTFTGVQLALNDVSPSSVALGTLNAFAIACVSGVRALAPEVFTSVFAAGVKKQILGGYLIWVVFFGMALVWVVSVRYLPEKAEGKVRDEIRDEER
ncbi:major facilitator superfamily domain-containing protein [Lineolata rhizophorae]|uniref:Major facilitator superfamily domain-containing protein n=1 Tax=Lineolata rhizophorae TaxID=578093 RepID=A0A6A6NYL1_9PEZI|nr:major facilitator superfamily domain-containing protein [Lineolata rhizophorae]